MVNEKNIPTRSKLKNFFFIFVNVSYHTIYNSRHKIINTLNYLRKDASSTLISFLYFSALFIKIFRTNINFIIPHIRKRCNTSQLHLL